MAFHTLDDSLPDHWPKICRLIYETVCYGHSAIYEGKYEIDVRQCSKVFVKLHAQK